MLGGTLALGLRSVELRLRVSLEPVVGQAHGDAVEALAVEVTEVVAVAESPEGEGSVTDSLASACLLWHR